MSQQILETIADALVAELAAVMGSLLDADATSRPFAGAVEPAWAVGCRLDAPFAGRFTLGIPKADATSLAARLLMSDGEPSDADVVDALAEIGGQAFAALVSKGSVAGLAGTHRASRAG